MRLEFTKMEGAGNDFVVLDCSSTPFSLNAFQLQKIADRHFGVGCDQILVDAILVERYQSARNDRHRFTSFSMAKTVTAMLIGIAIAEGRIRSVDDPAAAYVPQLAGGEYGRTSLRHLLEMSSGVRFIERYSGHDDVARLWAETVLQAGTGGVEAVKPYNERLRSGGTTFTYASVETQVLGLVLRGAAGRPVAGYLQETIWQPMGAEADATWLVDRSGQEAVYCCLNAVYQFIGKALLLEQS